MIPPHLGFKLWIIPHRSHRIVLYTSQQADLEKVPHACVGVCSSEQIQSQVMVSLPGSNDFIGKLCINFFLFVSLSFPSVWSHSGYVEVGGSRCLSPVASRSPLLAELSSSPSQTAAQRSAGQLGSLTAFSFQVTVRRSMQWLDRALSTGQAVPRAVPALCLHGGCSWPHLGAHWLLESCVTFSPSKPCALGKDCYQGWSGMYCLLKMDLLNPAVPFKKPLGLLRYLVRKQWRLNRSYIQHCPSSFMCSILNLSISIWYI